MVGSGSFASRCGHFEKYIMSNFLNISFLTFLCVTAFGVLETRADALVPDQELKLRNNGGLDANINKIFDDVLPVIRDIIIKKGLDPLKIRDIHQELHGILGVHHGVINLSHGLMQGMSQVKRSGDVVVTYNDKIITLDAELILDIIDVAYDYNFKYWIITRSGPLDARLFNTKVRTVMKVDLLRYSVSLESLQATAVSKVNVKLEGGVVDKILSAAINTLIGSFKRQIIETVETIGSEIIREQLQKINEQIPRPSGTPQVMDFEDNAVVRNNDWDNMVDNIPTYIEFVTV